VQEVPGIDSEGVAGISWIFRSGALDLNLTWIKSPAVCSPMLG